jgi:hypothetical protein
MRINWLDRLVLGGRDPYQPVDLLRFVRLQYAWATSMLIVVCFVGFLWWSAGAQNHRDCLARNQQNRTSRQVLSQLIAANKADGDTNAERVWRQWAELAARSPLPRC